MNSKQLVEVESNNKQQIYLYREGLFWKAYERSAYAFCLMYRNYKPTKKYVKVVATELISIGFPTKVLPNLVPEASLNHISETEVVIKLEQPIDEVQFIEWKNQTPLTVAAAKTLSESNKSESEKMVSTNVNNVSVMDLLADRIMCYNLAEHTPMEAMQFICELKDMLKTKNIK